MLSNQWSLVLFFLAFPLIGAIPWKGRRLVIVDAMMMMMMMVMMMLMVVTRPMRRRRRLFMSQQLPLAPRLPRWRLCLAHVCDCHKRR
jgi:hypothetical protein